MKKNFVIRLRLETATGRNILAGILKRIKDSDNCAISIASDSDGLRRLAASASAIIVDTSAEADVIKEAFTSGKPVVLLNDWRFKEHPSNLGHIHTDDGEIGFKAADYFMSIGRFRSFGYVPAYAEREWSTKRGRAFAHRLGRKGLACRLFEHGGDVDLGDWLKALPKPAAVFCAWDVVAADVAFAAKKARIRIPSQMVLLGVDNDETFCTSASPQMSSIEFDAENEGRMAIDLLFRMMSSRKAKTARTICCGTVKRIVERESTAPASPAGLMVRKAETFIRDHADGKLRVADVASHLGISRRLLDLRFREITGRTVLAAVQSVQLERVRHLLRTTQLSIAEIGRLVNFRSENHLKRLFRATYGMTMSAAREDLRPTVR